MFSFRSENRWISGPDFAAAIAICVGSSMITALALALVHRHPTYSRRRRLAKLIHGLRSRGDPRPPLSEVPSRHVLPADLPTAVRQLDDPELEQLLSAVIAEQKRRGKKLSTEIPRKQRVEVVAAVPLTQGKLNAVRAAFKAGVTPSRIARQFGISQSDVRKALASEIPKR